MNLKEGDNVFAVTTGEVGVGRKGIVAENLSKAG